MGAIGCLSGLHKPLTRSLRPHRKINPCATVRSGGTPAMNIGITGRAGNCRVRITGGRDFKGVGVRVVSKSAGHITNQRTVGVHHVIAYDGQHTWNRLKRVEHDLRQGNRLDLLTGQGVLHRLNMENRFDVNSLAGADIIGVAATIIECQSK